MKVTLLEPLYGVKDGEVYPKWWPAGTVVEGDLAHSAIDEGKALVEKKRTALAPEHIKSALSSQPAQASPEPTAKRSRGRPRLSR